MNLSVNLSTLWLLAWILQLVEATEGGFIEHKKLPVLPLLSVEKMTNRRSAFIQAPLIRQYQDYHSSRNSKRCTHLILQPATVRGGSSTRKGVALMLAQRHYASQGQSNSQYYYLLNSYAVWRSIVISTCMLFLVRALIQSSPFTTSMPNFLCKLFCNLHEYNTRMKQMWKFSLPLLSSSCCAIQLFLNAIAGAGCAGFNTVLGPLRPYFVSILLFNTLNLVSNVGNLHLYQLALSWAVALMPELVHFANQRSQMYGGSLSSRTLSGGDLLSDGVSKEKVIELDITGMGCVACINKIDGTLRKLNTHIIEASSWLNENSNGGKARVTFQYTNEANKESLVKDIVSSVKEAGFDCALSIDE